MPEAPTTIPAAPIKHVFVLMLENRSFDHMFARSGIADITIATPNKTNTWHGTTYACGTAAPANMTTDPPHEFLDVLQQLTGQSAWPANNHYPPINNSGFVANYATSITEGAPPLAQDVGNIMASVDIQQQAPTFYTLASQFVICDHWFASLAGPTWPNRYFVHGASSAGLDHSPSQIDISLWETTVGFMFENGSIFDALTRKQLPYRLYQDKSGSLSGQIPQVSSLKNIGFEDVDSLEDLEEDLKNNYDACYTFIEPAYGNLTAGTYQGGSSQHPMDGVQGGDQLIKRVYNAIRNSDIWESSMLIITYDEHGGFYDSVSPPAATPPADQTLHQNNKNGFAFDYYGVRVPALIISPWVEKGGISSAVYDHSSILKTIETLFGLDPLTQRDANANSAVPLITTTQRLDCPQGL